MVNIYRKIIEVALPLEAISEEAAQEKFLRTGHPSTLHPWWSRKPAGGLPGDFICFSSG